MAGQCCFRSSPSRSTVIRSTPALPLLPLTCRNASLRASLTYFLHDSTRVGWAFGFTHRRERFVVFPSRLPGFTRRRRWKVQSQLDVQPLVALEIHVLLATLLVQAFSHRSRLGLSVDSTFSATECLTSLADDMTHYALTSALRSDRL